MAHPPLTLVMGNKCWSSWSLRPWVAMKRAGLDFEEVMIPLRQGEDTRLAALAHSPAAKVPVLKWGEEVIWDSLAILETLAERLPQAKLWPEEAQARAHARALAAEMHSGFPALRREMPMDFLAHAPVQAVTPEVAHDIARIVAAWTEARGRYGATGPFLFGGFSNADAMFAPVVSRLWTYGVDPGQYGDRDGVARAYIAAVLDMPEMKAWKADCEAETAA